jgi:aldehyde:ferredoxin oxidoreductase
VVECLNKGIIKPEDIDNVPLKLGDEELVWEVLRKVAFREGKLGDLLADGVALAGKKFGVEAENLAPQVKGKAYLGGDPRLRAMLWSLGILTNPRGGDALRCHNVWEMAFLPENRDSYPKYTGKSCPEIYAEAVRKLDMPDDLKKQIFGDPPKVDLEWIKNDRGKAAFTVWTENLVGVFNSLVTCMYSAGTQYLMVGLGPSTYADVLNQISGWNITYDELLEVGERVFNLQRLFNYRLKNWNYLNDEWADKRQYEPAPKGIYKGRAVPWDCTLKEYYATRGWSVDGIPSEKKLKQLKITFNKEKTKILA